MFARMGGVLAPIINMLHNHSPATPLVVFGASPLLGAVLALALPETANRPLPDTVEDAENWDPRYVVNLQAPDPGALNRPCGLFTLRCTCFVSYRRPPSEMCEDISQALKSSEEQVLRHPASQT